MSEQLTKVYGIDLGTTYSCISYVDEHGKPVVVPNEENERITPSVVFFDGDNVIVGSEAKSTSELYPDQVVAFVKRYMGDSNFKFKYNDNNYKPEEISSLILRKLVGDAEQSTGEKISDVVITCPAYFGINEREATKVAGDIAGLNVRGIINEPTAAAISYGMVEENDKKVVLVYDLGGGTFDITMIQITPESIEVICTDGDHRLGGKDWDDAIIEYLASQFQEETGLDVDILEDKDTAQSLRLAAEKAKKTLTLRDKVRVPVVYKTKKAGLQLTKEKFEEITKNLLERTISLTHEMLKEGQKKGHQNYDEILLVGGSVRMPQVAQRVKQEFNIEPKVFDPDEAVAKGAALYGWKLSINDKLIERMAKVTGKSVKELAAMPQEKISKEVRETAARDVARAHGLTNEAVENSKKTIKNVCSKSFGVTAVVDKATNKKLVFNLIKKNCTVPAEFTDTFVTLYDNQDYVGLPIMENEVTEDTNPVEKSIEIGNVTLEMPPGLPEGAPLDVTFKLNAEGRLDIKAVEAKEKREVNATLETKSILQGEELEEAKVKNQKLLVA
ncbi:MAG: Hsp70 family protein [bacterium]|nr:Hsp70 family protein [bacterium]